MGIVAAAAAGIVTLEYQRIRDRKSVDREPLVPSLPPVLPDTKPRVEQPTTSPVEPEKNQSTFESYLVTLWVPSTFKDLEVIVDGKPGNIVEVLPSAIKIRVPRKDAPTNFVLRGSRLPQPRSFSLLINHDNFEHSPFQ